MRRPSKRPSKTSSRTRRTRTTLGETSSPKANPRDLRGTGRVNSRPGQHGQVNAVLFDNPGRNLPAQLSRIGATASTMDVGLPSGGRFPRYCRRSRRSGTGVDDSAKQCALCGSSSLTFPSTSRAVSSTSGIRERASFASSTASSLSSVTAHPSRFRVQLWPQSPVDREGQHPPGFLDSEEAGNLGAWRVRHNGRWTAQML